MTYAKQEWIDQQTVISAARMDHIEGGVEAAHVLAGDLGARLTAAEGDATALDTRLATAEGQADDLDTRLATAEGQADDLDARLAAAEGSVAALPQVQAGRVVVDPVADTPTSVDVTFPVPFRAAPEMTASALSAAPGAVAEVTVDAITTTGARIWMRRNSAVATSVSWIAVAA